MASLSEYQDRSAAFRRHLDELKQRL